MNIASDTLVTIIEPWQAGLYQSLSQPLTLNRATGSVEHFAGHRRALEDKGDTKAAAGVATPIRLCVIELASVEARTLRALMRKVKTLAAHRQFWIDHPMTALLIEAAIVSDASALGLGPDEEGRLLRQLRGQP